MQCTRDIVLKILLNSISCFLMFIRVHIFAAVIHQMILS